MHRLSKAGMGVLGLVLATDVVAAATGSGVPQTPEWLVYAGLASLCPEDINDALMARLGGSQEDS